MWTNINNFIPNMTAKIILLCTESKHFKIPGFYSCHMAEIAWMLVLF